LAERFRIGVVGTGYVGLVTGTCLSHLGHQVVCIDRNEGRISALKAARMPFYEPGLEELVSQSLKQQRLSFADSGSLARLVGEAEVIFVAVDTPQGEDGSADLSNVADVARGIGWALARPESPRRERPLVVVNKSTVPVGSGDYVSMLVREGHKEAGGGEANVLVGSNPEFLREGSAIYDSLFPDRIVVGSESR
jgi:UDPglucose 6-dehydrogenase